MSTEMSQVRQLFMLFHGMYGNQFLDKFRTGDLDDAGKDKGILSAQKVWLNDLQKYDFETIRKAVAVCKTRHKTFAPSLPEFIDLCKSCAPSQYVSTAPALGMSDELKAEIRARNRQTLASLKLGAAERRDYGQGLPALLLMVAKSIGEAGGDEVKALLGLEAKFTPNAGALRH